MRKVVAVEWMSLDGVVQAPASANEDTSNGFKHGGWHVRYFDERSLKWVVENVSQAGGFLLGRGTYQMFAAHWPSASAEEQALARPRGGCSETRRGEGLARNRDPHARADSSRRRFSR